MTLQLLFGAIYGALIIVMAQNPFRGRVPSKTFRLGLCVLPTIAVVALLIDTPAAILPVLVGAAIGSGLAVMFGWSHKLPDGHSSVRDPRHRERRPRSRH